MYHQNRTGAAGSDISQSVYGSKENKISTGTLSDQPARGESGIQEYKVRQCTVYRYKCGEGSKSERLDSDRSTSLTIHIHVSCTHVATQEKPLNSA